MVYLPGLGEASDADARWRAAWAAAGYVLLAVQPLDDDATAFQSDLARGGEFRALGRQHFGDAAMARRLAALADVLAQARQRGAAGEAPWSQVEWARVGVAGFDLGAYAAMALAGEQLRGVAVPAGLAVRAVVALSPHATADTAADAATAGALDTRYGAIRLPVLSATGESDIDLLGLVATPALRRAPFEHTAAADQWLLTLRGLSHAAFGGEPHEPQGDGGVPIEPIGLPDGDRPDPADNPQRRRNNRRQGVGDGPRADGRPALADDGGGHRLSPTAAGLRAIALQQVSLAFLDATLKDDRRARAWLADDAGPWLGGNGELLRK